MHFKSLWGFVKALVPQQHWLKHAGFVAFLVILLVLGFFPQKWLQSLEFHYSAAISWRWYTAHFVHLTPSHAVMNVAGSAALWLLVVAYAPARLLLLGLLVLPWIVSLGLYSSEVSEGMVSYRGFSGILYGFYFMGAFFSFWKERLTAIVLLVFLVVKISVEQQPAFDKSYLMDDIGGWVAVDAHLFGLIGGIAMVLIYCLLAYFRRAGCILPWVRYGE